MSAGKKVDWGVLLAAFAVIVATAQGWVSYQALRESREGLLANRRIDACVEMQEQATAILSAGATYEALVHLLPMRREDRWNETHKIVVEAYDAFTDAEAVVEVIGPDSLRDTSARMGLGLTNVMAAPHEPQATSASVSAAVSQARSRWVELHDACRAAIGVFRTVETD